MRSNKTLVFCMLFARCERARSARTFKQRFVVVCVSGQFLRLRGEALRCVLSTIETKLAVVMLKDETRRDSDPHRGQELGVSLDDSQSQT